MTTGFLNFRIFAVAAMAVLVVGLLYFLLPQLDIGWQEKTQELRSLVAKLPFFETNKETVSLKAPGSPKVPKDSHPVPEVSSRGLENAAWKSNERSHPATDTPETLLAAFPKGSGDYRIQLFSLNEVALADGEVEQLREEGFDAYWKKASSRGQDWYIVYVGPFKNMKPARIYVDALKYSGRNPILLSVAKSG